ncbi:MAG: dTDP-4-dehydrorhamnose 3,5-epimerase family protein [Candidatus Omnitrophota bacterium]
MIEGVQLKKLQIVSDARGRLMEILRCDDKFFQQFGQVYMTTAKPGIVKAWHYHKIQTDNFTCVSGQMKLALYDARENSSTYLQVQDFIIDLDNPLLVQIPPYVYHGFKCISDKEAIVINTPTAAYNHKHPDEYRVDPYRNEIPYNWEE